MPQSEFDTDSAGAGEDDCYLKICDVDNDPIFGGAGPVTSEEMLSPDQIHEVLGLIAKLTNQVQDFKHKFQMGQVESTSQVEDHLRKLREIAIFGPLLVEPADMGTKGKKKGGKTGKSALSSDASLIEIKMLKK